LALECIPLNTGAVMVGDLEGEISNRKREPTILGLMSRISTAETDYDGVRTADVEIKTQL
jgi:hypothetical protein